MCARRLIPSRKFDLFSNANKGMKNDEDPTYIEPETWNIIAALDRVLYLAQGSALSDEFYEKCKNPLAYLRQELGLTDMQIIVIAILIEAGQPLSWRGIGNFLNISRLSVMVHSEEVEELVNKRWIIHSAAEEMNGMYEGFKLVRGVVTALRKNKPFVPEKIDNLTLQQFVDRVNSYIRQGCRGDISSFIHDENWLVQIIEANQHLPLCQEIARLKDIHSKSLMCVALADYVKYANAENEGITIAFDIDSRYPED